MAKEKKKASTHEVFGLLEWPRVFKFNRDMVGPEGADWGENHDGMYVTNLVVDEENYDLFIESGSAHTPKKIKEGDHEGKWRIQFKRPHEHKYPQYGGAPQVVHDDNTPWDAQEDGLIGNFSSAYVLFTVYETNLSNGTRMEGVQIIDHIEYIGAGDKPEFEDRSGKPKHTKKDKKSKKKSKSVDMAEDLEDEIPF